MIFTLSHDIARTRAKAMIDQAPEGWVVRIDEPTRTLEQNALLWPLLNNIAKQVLWHGRRLSAENWKDIFTASLSQMDVVPNLEGTGFVILGQSTSKMGKKKFSELIELIYAFGAEKGVEWSDERDAI